MSPVLSLLLSLATCALLQGKSGRGWPWLQWGGEAQGQLSDLQKVLAGWRGPSGFQGVMGKKTPGLPATTSGCQCLSRDWDRMIQGMQKIPGMRMLSAVLAASACLSLAGNQGFPCGTEGGGGRVGGAPIVLMPSRETPCSMATQ